jgi:hypothetical protein
MITPLSQGAITILGVLGMAGNSPFREAVDQVLSIKNFKNRSEWEAAVQDLFGGKKSPFVAMYELFLSRTEYGSTDYEEVEDEDPHLKKFIETEDRCEDRCKYKNVYPFLEDYETAYDHFSYSRPLVLRRYLNELRARLSLRRRGHTLVFFPETYDLVLPTAVRRSYYRRLRTAISPFPSSGNVQVVLPNQLPFVQREIDQVLEKEGKISEANSGDMGEEGTEGWPSELASDKLITGTLQLNYRFATRFALFSVRRLSSLSKQMFELLAERYKDDPRKFILAVHSLMESIVYSSIMNPSIVPVFIVEKKPAETKDRYRAKAVATLLAFRHYVMSVDPFYSGLSSIIVIRSALSGRSSVPFLSSLGVSRTVKIDLEKLVEDTVRAIVSKELGYPTYFNVSLEPEASFVSRIPSSSVFDKGVISVLSGPRLGGGTITIQTIPINIYSSSLDSKVVKAILDYGEKALDHQNMSGVENIAIGSFNKGLRQGLGTRG